MVQDYPEYRENREVDIGISEEELEAEIEETLDEDDDQ